MTDILIRLFIKEPERTDAVAREKYGVLASGVSVVANLLLCAAKFLIGVLSGSIAVQADAVNNLSDIGSNMVTLVGFRAAARPADKEHPYGHARIEYIAALIIAFLILVVGFELGKESVGKVIAPTPVSFTPASMLVLVLSILTKLWMGRFTAAIGRRIDSAAMQAATADSLCDAISTGAILLSSVIAYFWHVNLDGYFGLLVAAFVLYSGGCILRDTISPLMGEGPSRAEVMGLDEDMLAYDGIIGVHDILIHRYGPGCTIASAHAEVRSDSDIMAIHEVIDRAEREIGAKRKLLLTIHLDPVEVDNAVLNKAKEDVSGILHGMEPPLRFHDFRMVSGKKQNNLIFDLVVPAGTVPEEAERIVQEVKGKARQIDPTYCCVIEVDQDFSGIL